MEILMSIVANAKKDSQLGMSHGTAVHRLRKSIIFALLGLLNLNVCFQCGEAIKSLEDLSVEHKVPWLDSEDPKKLFFDLSNIAFSHLVCNIKTSRKTGQKYFTEDERLAAKRIWNRTAYAKRGPVKKIYDSERRRRNYLKYGQ